MARLPRFLFLSILAQSLLTAGCGERPETDQGIEADSTAGDALDNPSVSPGRREPVERLLLATTTSLYDTGLWTVLEPMFEDRCGVELDILYAGTGKALEWGMGGDVDVVVVHDRASEDQFIADGYGLSRTVFAYNYFVVVGPADDPAGIAGMAPESAFVTLYENGTVPFISRGDESGTHAMEQRLWAAAGLDYETVRTSGDWYVEAGAGMGQTLNMANEMRGYTLSDIGTFLAYRGDIDLDILIEQSPATRNDYAVIPVAAASDSLMAANMVTFLTSPDIQAVIDGYCLEQYGCHLFYAGAGQVL
ncbi:tungsten ABC transporter substrate-binding protein [Candidatus Fermentibacteria bacterium]|nr:tungsten ABC transporter substrate-binding protein [Candidatus Fermentibacteria bacterium]